jgi:tetratricopeptide (TPR) repeat protein
VRAALLLFLAAFAAPAGAEDGAARARALAASGRPAEAAEQWEKTLGPGASDKALREGLTPLGRAHEAAGNYQKALTAYQRALQLDEKNPDRYLDLARVYARVDLDEEAISLYRHVRKLAPGRRDVAFVLARLYLKAGRLDDARREAAQHVAWEPRDPAGQELLADLDEAEGDLKAAAARRQGLTARAPSPEAYFDLGRLWMRAGDWLQADAAFEQAENLGLRTGVLYLHRGVAAWLRKDPAAAESLWKKALERHPGLGAAHFFLGRLALEKGDAAGAARRMRLAREGAQGDFLKDLAAPAAAGKGGGT